MYCSFIARDRQILQIIRESQAIYFCSISTSPYFLQEIAFSCVVDSNKCSLGASSCNEPPILRQREARDTGSVCINKLGLPCPIVFHPNLPLLGTGANKHDRPGLLRHSAEALGVGRRLDLVHELKVREVVDEDFVLEYHDDAVAPEPDASYGGAEGELPDAAALVVVPDHDLVRRVVGIIAAADEREYVAAEQHLDDAAVVTFLAPLASHFEEL